MTGIIKFFGVGGRGEGGGGRRGKEEGGRRKEERGKRKEEGGARDNLARDNHVIHTPLWVPCSSWRGEVGSGRGGTGAYFIEGRLQCARIRIAAGWDWEQRRRRRRRSLFRFVHARGDSQRDGTNTLSHGQLLLRLQIGSVQVHYYQNQFC